MRIPLIAIAGLLFQAQGASVKGSISARGASMTLLDTVAVWDPAKSELRVSLMPFKIQDKHLKDIRKDSAMFAVLGQKTPDPKKWADWSPGAEVKFTLDAKALDKGTEALQSYHFWAYGLDKKNFTDNMNREGVALRDEVSKFVLKLDAKGSGTFELTFAGKSPFDGGMAWEITAKGSVLAPLADK